MIRIARKMLGKVIMLLKHNASLRIEAIVAAARPVELIELETQRDDLQAKKENVYEQLRVALEKSDGRFSSAMEIKNPVSMAAAAARAAILAEEAASLDRKLTELRRDISAAKSASGVALALAVLSVNMLGDGLRDTLDPRFSRRL